MKKLIAMCAVFTLFIPAGMTKTSQDSAKPLTDTDIQLLRSDVNANKQTIIADTMKFTDAESTRFWPVYRDYAHDQSKIGDELVQLIKDYASNYETMSDDMASDLVQRLINIEDKTNNLREDYWPKFKTALGAKRAAKFYQVDHRLTMIVNMQLARATPLLP